MATMHSDTGTSGRAAHSLPLVDHLSPRGLPTRPLTTADLEAMRRAHMREVEASQRCERRFGRRRADRALIEARRAEAELLDQFGFTSYGDFIVSAWRVGADTTGEIDLRSR